MVALAIELVVSVFPLPVLMVASLVEVLEGCLLQQALFRYLFGFCDIYDVISKFLFVIGDLYLLIRPSIGLNWLFMHAGVFKYGC